MRGSFCSVLYGRGAVSYTSIPPILFFLSRRGLSLLSLCYLAGVIKELEEYHIFSNAPLDGAAGSQSSISKRVSQWVLMTLRGQCGKSRATW